MRLAALLMLASGACAAQDRPIGKVIDATTREPLPFCSVALQQQGPGTLTNSDGVFELPPAASGDSIVFSMVGYKRAIMASRDLIPAGVVELEPSTTELAGVEVRPG